MAICTITGTIVDSTATGINGATIKFNVTAPQLDVANNLIMPFEVNTTSNSSGVFTLALDQGISGICAIEYPPNSTDSNRRHTFSILVPATSTATFASLITEI